MFSTFPIRMNFVPWGNKDEVPVDVYEFKIIQHNGLFKDTAVALCWFVQSKEWKVVDVEQLIPIESKTLNE